MWTEQNPTGTYPRLYFEDMGGLKNTRPSTYWLRDGSYFRLKNLTFGYTLPKDWTHNIHIRMVRLYFSGDNLLTFTRFPKGGDPERHYDSVHGSHLALYPPNKIYSLGIHIEF